MNLLDDYEEQLIALLEKAELEQRNYVSSSDNACKASFEIGSKYGRSDGIRDALHLLSQLKELKGV